MYLEEEISPRDRFVMGYDPRRRIVTCVPFVYVDQSVPDWKKRLTSLISYLEENKILSLSDHLYTGYSGTEDVSQIHSQIRMLFAETEHFLGPEEVKLRAVEFSHIRYCYVLFLDLGAEVWDYEYNRYITDKVGNDRYRFHNGFLASSSKVSRGVV